MKSRHTLIYNDKQFIIDSLQLAILIILRDHPQGLTYHELATKLKDHHLDCVQKTIENKVINLADLIQRDRPKGKGAGKSSQNTLTLKEPDKILPLINELIKEQNVSIDTLCQRFTEMSKGKKRGKNKPQKDNAKSMDKEIKVEAMSLFGSMKEEEPALELAAISIDKEEISESQTSTSLSAPSSTDNSSADNLMPPKKRVKRSSRNKLILFPVNEHIEFDSLQLAIAILLRKQDMSITNIFTELKSYGLDCVQKVIGNKLKQSPLSEFITRFKATGVGAGKGSEFTYSLNDPKQQLNLDHGMSLQELCSNITEHSRVHKGIRINNDKEEIKEDYKHKVRIVDTNLSNISDVDSMEIQNISLEINDMEKVESNPPILFKAFLEKYDEQLKKLGVFKEKLLSPRNKGKFDSSLIYIKENQSERFFNLIAEMVSDKNIENIKKYFQKGKLEARANRKADIYDLLRYDHFYNELKKIIHSYDNFQDDKLHGRLFARFYAFALLKVVSEYYPDKPPVLITAEEARQSAEALANYNIMDNPNHKKFLDNNPPEFTGSVHDLGGNAVKYYNNDERYNARRNNKDTPNIIWKDKDKLFPLLRDAFLRWLKNVYKGDTISYFTISHVIRLLEENYACSNLRPRTLKEINYIIVHKLGLKPPKSMLDYALGGRIAQRLRYVVSMKSM